MPIPADPWTDVYEAFNLTVGCPQTCVLPPHTCPPTISEDCLYLNVFAPVGSTPSSNLPVFVFIPGGRYEQGYGGGALYSGSYASNISKTVFVTINYRLGTLGFLHTGVDGIDGNFGIADQQLALRWVQTNIAQFGGDASRVTVGGQSAGAMSTATHLISPASKGLFHQAIVQSDPFTLPFYNPAQAGRLAKRFAEDSGCKDETDTSCLRALNVSTILTSQGESQKHFNLFNPLEMFVPWTPVVDGTLVPGQPMDLISRGEFQRVPILMGTVKNEARMFIFEAAKKPVPKEEYNAVLAAIFLDEYFKVHRLFPPIQGAADQRTPLSELGTSYIFECSTRHVGLGASQYTSVFRYQFNEVWSFPDAWGPRYYGSCAGYVCHASELPFEFNVPQNSNETFILFQPGEQELANELTAYWMNFVQSGNPNQGPVSVKVQWPSYDKDDKIMTFNVTEDYLHSNNLVQQVYHGPMVFGDEAEKLKERLQVTELPEMVFPHNRVDISLPPSGLRFSLDVEDALREWDFSAAPGVRVKAAEATTWSAASGDSAARTFNWTFYTQYAGSLLFPDGFEWRASDDGLDYDLLRRPDPFLLFDELVLFEDEIADNGVAMLTVKLRVMPAFAYLLVRYFLRVDDVTVRIVDSRVFLPTVPGAPVRREREEREMDVPTLRKRVGEASKLALPDELWPHMKTKWSQKEILVKKN